MYVSKYKYIYIYIFWIALLLLYLHFAWGSNLEDQKPSDHPQQLHDTTIQAKIITTPSARNCASSHLELPQVRNDKGSGFPAQVILKWWKITSSFQGIYIYIFLPFSSQSPPGQQKISLTNKLEHRYSVFPKTSHPIRIQSIQAKQQNPTFWASSWWIEVAPGKFSGSM